MSSLPHLTDGDYSVRLLIAPTKITWPFLNWPVKDTATKIFERLYEIDRASYTPFAALATLPDDGAADPADAAAYLIHESEPEVQPDGTQSVRCRFAHIPPTQTKSGLSLMVNLPSLSGPFPKVFGSYRVFQPDTTLGQFDAYTAQTVLSDTGAPAFYPGGGTYTLTFGSDTTGALNYNDSAGTVQTALNALASVTNRGGLTVAGSYNSAGGLVVTWNSYAAVTRGLGSITCVLGTATSAIVALNSGYTQQIRIQSTDAAYNDGRVSGGTYTITVGADTTAAIAYNAAPAAIAAALNLLTSVVNRGGCTVTGMGWDGGYNWIDFVINFAGNAAFTGNASALTVAPCTITGALSDSVGVLQTIKFAGGAAVRTIFCPGHGLSAGDTLYIKGGSTYYGGIAGTFVVPDANTITLTVSPSAAYAAASTITEVGKRTKAAYIPGSKPVPCTQVTRFSATALSLDSYQGEGDGFLQAIFSGDTTINYRVGDATPWPSDPSPIKSLTTTIISAADL